MCPMNVTDKQLTKIASAILLTVMLLTFTTAEAKHLNSERYYQERDCKGQVEVTLPGRSRCDCITKTHAIEYEFASKWAEAIGQSLFYALQTNKEAGIALIIEKESDYRFWIRLNSTIEHHELPITAWIVSP